MQLLESMAVQNREGTGRGRIELLSGDLTVIPKDHEVDVLVVSAFPGDYTPTEFSLIGALHKKGLHIAELARAPESDLRDNFSCWLSQPLASSLSTLNFARVLCFEPLVRGNAPDVVGDIFRSLAPFVYAPPGIKSIAMPVVAAGDQRHPFKIMLEALLDATWHWMAIGMPLEIVKLVVRSSDLEAEARSIFRAKLASMQAQDDAALHSSDVACARMFDDGRSPEYDVFISYSRSDVAAATFLSSGLRNIGAKVFMDQSEIAPGAAWQQKIFDALEVCEITAALYSPDFIQSKVCKDEFNISWARQREMGREVIFPLLIRDAALPTYMKMLNYFDCRVSDQDKLSQAAKLIGGRIGLRVA